ncbi:iron ABC transporter permease [Candidatus Woesearchaeota archaeon]|nr:iron ABC transporter permease [Candidatus Woesearchaeota archaeon]
MREIKNKRLFLVVLVFLLILVSVICISIGPVKISLRETAGILLSPLLGKDASGGINPTNATIILRIRLPRIIMAIITGAALSVAGVAFQALLRNPLADPYVLGVSSGAALGASVAIAFGLLSLIPFFGFIGALATMYIVYLLAKTGSRISVTSLILAGVVMGAFLSSLISLIMALLGDDMHKVMFWLMGSLAYTDTKLASIVFALVLLGTAVIYLLSRDLNLILLGEEPAQHLGANTELVKKVLFASASLITGAVVSVTGLIGFVGLIIPHTVRLLIGPKHNTLIVGSALVGSIFLIIADTAARTVIAPAEIPIGVITALVGAPFFLFLLVKKKKGMKNISV